jgi:uncharacterized membrane protein (UPF0127 family)
MQRLLSLKNKIISTYLAHPFKIIFIILGFILFGYYLTHFHKPIPNFTEVKINGNTIYSQIADTENERSLGLSYTKKLDENAGMLFIFENIGVKNFWMRDMNYNIDIIWIDENKTVLGFFENADKNSYNAKYPEYSRIFKSPENTKYVLEVATGTIQNLKIKTGDVLEFKY